MILMFVILGKVQYKHMVLFFQAVAWSLGHEEGLLGQSKYTAQLQQQCALCRDMTQQL